MDRYILDTNFISELRKSRVNKGCAEWMSGHTPESAYLTTITLCEIMQGIALREEGVEKKDLRKWLEVDLMNQFAERIFVFDRSAALIYGERAAKARREGQPRPILDLQIAAIAAAHECAIVSRNTRDFTGLGVKIINPWT